ncbi:Zinc finger HIT-type [Trinorchestia longiramus]|nr:Zinc finger HIT-type [Trinorchestia longiramus]
MGCCELCSKNPSRYTCPRCNVHYCSMQCYAGPLHSTCSEGFYKEQVQQQLHNHRAPPDSREKMKQMLRRLEEEDVAADATLPSFNQPGCETGPLQGEENEELDSDDDDDLEERLKGVDLDDSDEVWSRLTEDERRQFRQLVQTGDVTAVLPPFQPWWHPTEGSDDTGAAIIELDEAEAHSFKRGRNTSNILEPTINPENLIKNEKCEEVGQTSESDVKRRICSENSSLVSTNLEVNVDDLATSNASDSFAALNSSNKPSECNNSPSKFDSSKCIDSSCSSDASSMNTKSNIPLTRCMSCSAKSDFFSCSKCSLSTSSSSKLSSSTTSIDLSQPSQSSSDARRGSNKKSQLKNRRIELVNAFPCVPAALKAKYPNCPPLPQVKLLSNLISVTPSQSIRYSLLNVMVGYAWLMRLFHGDLMDRSMEAAEGLLLLCGSMDAGQVYCSSQEAHASVTMRALQVFLILFHYPVISRTVYFFVIHRILLISCYSSRTFIFL